MANKARALDRKLIKSADPGSDLQFVTELALISFNF